MSMHALSISNLHHWSGSNPLPRAQILVPQAGTFGRFMGNMVLSMAARITRTNTVDEIISFSAVLFGTAAFWMAFSLVFVMATYRHLVG